jgi:hypothetical protein
MLTLELDCPTGGNIVVYPGTGACSGSVGTICVYGQYSDSSTVPQFLIRLLAFFKRLIRHLLAFLGLKPPGTPVQAGLFVRVRVLNGSVQINNLPSPIPKQPCDVDTTPSGKSWFASGVPVPAYSSSGAQLTVVAWLMNADGTQTSAAPQSAQFNGGGPSAFDCCSGGGSGSASGMSVVARELASNAPLEVAVPDGPNAGLHRAKAVGPFTWDLTVRGVAYRVCRCGASGLAIRGPSSSVSAASIEGSPFSATFPGSALAAAGDVVVTLA